MNKLMNIDNAVKDIKNGSVIMIGGFLTGGHPQNLVGALVNKGLKNLTIITSDTGSPDCARYRLIKNKQVSKVYASYIGLNPETGIQMESGEIQVELFPQGTLVEKIRAGGAGLGGFLTPTGIGTKVEEGKKKIKINGKEYLLELPLRADIALIKAFKADEKGNLTFRGSSRNFNLVMATAADYVVAEIEEYVKSGEIDPNEVMLPGIFIDAVVKGGK